MILIDHTHSILDGTFADSDKLKIRKHFHPPNISAIIMVH